MDNFTEADRSENVLIADLSSYALLEIIILAGLLIQSFIVAVNVIDWMKGRAITGADKIITSIGISRIFYHIAYLLYCASWFHLPDVYYILSLCVILNMSSFSSLCLSTLLSIFFYFKISTFPNNFLFRLKAIISRRIVCLIFASVLLSVAYSSVDTLVNIILVFTNSTEDFFSGNSQQQMFLGWNLAWNTIPLLLYFTVSVLLLILFGFHLCKMNNHGNAISSTDTYHRIMKFTVFSFLTNVMYILVPFIYMAIESEDISWFFYDCILNMLLVLHSVLIIYASTKLRNQFFRIVHCGTISLCNRNAPGPPSREPVEVTRL